MSFGRVELTFGVAVGDLNGDGLLNIVQGNIVQGNIVQGNIV